MSEEVSLLNFHLEYFHQHFLCGCISVINALIDIERDPKAWFIWNQTTLSTQPVNWMADQYHSVLIISAHYVTSEIIRLCYRKLWFSNCIQHSHKHVCKVYVLLIRYLHCNCDKTHTHAHPSSSRHSSSHTHPNMHVIHHYIRSFMAIIVVLIAQGYGVTYEIIHRLYSSLYPILITT